MKINRYSPALVCGFGVGVLTTIPGIKNFSCCLIVPAAAVLSLFFYLKINSFYSRLLTKDALLFGLFTGISAAMFSTFFDVLITFIFKSNEIVSSLPQIEVMLNDLNLGDMTKQTMAMIKQMTIEIQATGFSTLYTIFLLLNNLIGDIIFGIIGGFAGMAILNKKYFPNF
jgi:hypothetical protein